MKKPFLATLLSATNQALYNKNNESSGREIVGEFDIMPHVEFENYMNNKSVTLRFVREPLARGASAEISKAYSTNDYFPSSSYPLAVKKMHYAKILRDPAEQYDKTDYYVLLQREINAVRDICYGEEASVFVTRFFGTFYHIDFEENWLIFEYCQGGDLRFLRRQDVNLDHLAAISANIVCALEVVHELGYVHADLKPDNLLLSKPGIVKICDFGLAAKFKDVEEPELHALGTTRYMSPELMKRNVYLDNHDDRAESVTYDYKTDVWSVGVLLLEFLIGFCPLFHLRKIGNREEIYCDYIKNMTKQVTRNIGSALPQFLSLRSGYHKCVQDSGRNPNSEVDALLHRYPPLQTYRGDLRGVVVRPHLDNVEVDPAKPVPKLKEPGLYRINLFMDFIAQCLICYPSNRPSIHDLKQHQFIKRQCRELDTLAPILQRSNLKLGSMRQQKQAFQGVPTSLTLDKCRKMIQMRDESKRGDLCQTTLKSRFSTIGHNTTIPTSNS